MTNTEINAIKEFRRFVNTYIYPSTAYKIIGKISEECDTIAIEYSSLPQATIKFCSDLKCDNLSNTTQLIHDILKVIFVEYFNDIEVSSLIKNKIHTDISDDNLKDVLRYTLQQIQIGNPLYMGLLFNITILNNQISYLYL